MSHPHFPAGERKQNVLISQPPWMDDLYATETLNAAQGVKEWLEGNDDDVTMLRVNGFFRILEEMKNRTPFQPHTQPHEEPPLFTSKPFEHREPVWQLIDSETALQIPSYLERTSGATAEMLQGILKQIRLYRQFMARVAIVS